MDQPNRDMGLTSAESALLAQVGGDLKRRYENIKAEIAILWPEGRRIVKSFTDHGPEHSQRVLDRAYQLLSLNGAARLNAEEAFVLLVSVLLHDVGLQCHLAGYPEIKKIAQQLGEPFGCGSWDVEFASSDPEKYTEDEQRELRRYHGLVSAAALTYAWRKKKGPLEKVVAEIPTDLQEDVRDVCLFHTLVPIRDCPEGFKLPGKGRKQFVTAVVRFADELDIDEYRASPETIAHLPVSVSHAKHWFIHGHTRVSLDGTQLWLVLFLHPNDVQEYSQLLRDKVVERFRLKNRDVINLLNVNGLGFNFDGQIIGSEAAEPLPAEIISELEDEGASEEDTRSDRQAASDTACPADLREGDIGAVLRGLASTLTKSPEPSDLNLLRLHALSAAQIFTCDTGSVLGNREVNRLYEHKSEAKLSFDERFLVLRTMLADTSGYVPGWALLTDKPDLILAQIENRGQLDPGAQVREGALNLLAKVDGSAYCGLYRDALKDSPESVRTKAAHLLARYGTSADRDLIAEVESNLPADVGRECRLVLEARCSGSAVMKLMGSDCRSFAPRVLNYVPASDVPDPELDAGLDSACSPVRVFCGEELLRRGESMDRLAEFQNDRDITLRAMGIRARILSDESLTQDQLDGLLADPDSGDIWFRLSRPRLDAESLRRLYLVRLSRSRLESAVTWSYPWGPLAYEVLATQYFGDLRDTVLGDITEGFTRIRTKTLELRLALCALGGVEKTVAAARERVESSLAVSDKIIRSAFAEAAAAIAAVKGDAGFLGLVRERADDTPQWRLGNVVTALARLGDESDAATLTDMACQAYGESRTMAADAALRLAPDPVAVATTFRDKQAFEALRVALRFLMKAHQPEALAICRDLLDSELDVYRLLALAHLVKAYRRPQTEKMLSQYMHGRPYFFNVTCWLDRVLYAPMRLRTLFRRELLGRI